MKVHIINESNNNLPEYKTEGSAGMDIRANIADPINIKPLQRVLVPTGLKMSIPEGYELQIRPRSGLAINHGITVLNSPGTIDSDYRGEIKVMLINLGDEDFTINHGDRIAQIVIAKYDRVQFEIVTELDETARGEGGFNSTGIA